MLFFPSYVRTLQYIRAKRRSSSFNTTLLNPGCACINTSAKELTGPSHHRLLPRRNCEIPYRLLPRFGCFHGESIFFCFTPNKWPLLPVALSVGAPVHQVGVGALGMAQHFLLSAASRDKHLTVQRAFSFTDREVRDAFATLRWGQAKTQSCPHCAVHREHRFVSSQNRWRCRDCYQPFSVTSGTVFNNHKLSLQVILAAMVIYANAVKGLSALQLSRDLNIQYKTAFVLLHKIRESLWTSRDTTPLQGEVEIDGAYTHTYVRPKNRKKDRVDRTVGKNQNPNKQNILVLRERSGEKKKGASRTRVFALRSEASSDVLSVIRANVMNTATVITEEAPGYNDLHLHFALHQRVKHAEEYRTKDGVTENQAESYIARFRRMVRGQIHKLAPKNLEVYANEAAFREDRRRKMNGDFVREVLGTCLTTEQSREWAKYWQRRSPIDRSALAMPNNPV